MFTDRNLSAFKRGIVRPDYEAMKARVVAGDFDAIIAYRLDRLSRSLSEALKLIELLDDNGTGLLMVNGDVDTTGRMGRAFFQISAIFAELEAATTSDRLKSYNSDAASKGQMPTGGRRCYGYIGKGENRGQIIMEEADHLRAAAQDIRDKISIREATRRMNERGSRTTMGKEWSPRSLVKCLKSPRLRGKRIHLGQLTDGDWTGIFSEDEQLDLINRINQAGATYRDNPRIGNDHLLTGLATCGICGHRLGYGRTKKGEVVHARYVCKRTPGSTACGGVSCAEASLDSYVVATVREFGHLFVVQADVRRRELEDQMADDQAELEATQRRYDKLQFDYYEQNPPMSEEVYAELTSTMLARIKELKDALSRPSAELEKLPEPSWIRTPLDRMPTGVHGREHLRKYLTAVEVMPARHRGGRFEGGRVKMHWIGGQVTTDADLGVIDYAADLGIL